MASGFSESLQNFTDCPNTIFVSDSLVSGMMSMGFTASGYSQFPKKLDPTDLLVCLGLTYNLQEVWRLLAHLIKGGSVGFWISQTLIFSSAKGFVSVKNIDTRGYLYRYRRLSRAIGNTSFFGYRRYLDGLMCGKKERPNSFVIDSSSTISVALGSNWSERQVNLRTFARIIETLPVGATVVFLGHGRIDEAVVTGFLHLFSSDHLNLINNVSKTSLETLISHLRDSSFYLGGDSGISHIAYHLGLPIFVMGGCVPVSWRYASKMPSDQQHLRWLFDGSSLCDSWPCYTGLHRPVCHNKDPYICTQHLNARLPREMKR